MDQIAKACSCALLITLLFSATFLYAQEIPAGFDAKGLRPVGYCDMEGRPAFKLSIKEHGGKWYLFTGHSWHSGWSVVDVTQPDKPKVVRFVEGPANTWTLQMELHGNTMITAMEKIFPDFGGNNKPFTAGIYIWDISDPVNPKRLGHYATGGTGTHRNFYNGGKYVHLAAGLFGYTGNIYVIVDISDRSKPVEVSRWWVPGQEKKKSRDTRPAHHAFCGMDSEVSLHGPPYVVDSLVYLPYGSAGMIILDISDIRHPRQVSRLDFSPPFHAKLGMHGVLPIPEKRIAFVNSEDVSYGKDALSHASIVDLKDLRNPQLMALFPQPVTAEGKSYREEKGWSGPHNFNLLLHNKDVAQQGDIFYLTWFNAGLRVYDVADVYAPKEIGHFIPAKPSKRYGRLPADDLVIQTEDVLVDRRGYIYITDKNQGIYILKREGGQ